MASNCRQAPGGRQVSENSALRIESCWSGLRPQRMTTGTSCTSTCGSATAWPEQARQQGGVSAAVACPAGQAAVTVEKEEGARQALSADRHRRLGARQPGLPRLLEENQQVREMPVLKDVTDRFARVEAKFLNAFRKDRGAHPQIQQAARQRDEPVGNLEELGHGPAAPPPAYCALTPPRRPCAGKPGAAASPVVPARSARRQCCMTPGRRSAISDATGSHRVRPAAPRR
jgi:hypothetical protein